jgi:hypothetical protein
VGVLIFQQQQCEIYAAPFHLVVNNATGLVVDILNICEFKVTVE